MSLFERTLVPSFLQGMRHSCCPLVTFSEWVGVENIEPPTLHFPVALREPKSPYTGAGRHDCQNEQDSASAKPGRETSLPHPHAEAPVGKLGSWESYLRGDLG